VCEAGEKRRIGSLLLTPPTTVAAL
jgi:hypothetical protein